MVKEYGDRCTPEWTEKEILHSLETALQKGDFKGRTRGFGLLDEQAEDGEEQAEAASSATFSTKEVPVPIEQPWPAPLAPDVFDNLAGAVVRVIEPHSEADPVALLFQFLIGFGSLIGRRAHFTVEATKHYTNEFLVLVGETSKARKGTSWGVRELFLELWLAGRILAIPNPLRNPHEPAHDLPG